MKTLILNGSPRKNGDTASLIKLVKNSLRGEVLEINAYTCDISPCVDCRYCWSNKGCVIADEMQVVYDYIQECDNILIASPIYFSEVTGKLLDVASRLQTYFCARFFRKEEPINKCKRGAVFLVGGGDGRIDKAFETSSTILHHMNCNDIHEVVYSHNTNIKPAAEDKQVLEGVSNIVDYFNEMME